MAFSETSTTKTFDGFTLIENMILRTKTNFDISVFVKFYEG